MLVQPTEWLNEFLANVTDQGLSGGNDQSQSRVVQLQNGNILVAWASNANPPAGAGSVPGTDIVGRIFDPAGNPVSLEIQLNSVNDNSALTASFPSIEPLPGGGFTAVYRSSFGNLTNPGATIEADVYNDTGIFQRNVEISPDPFGSIATADTNREPEVAVISDTRAFVIYGDEGDITGTVYNPQTGAIVATNIVIGAGTDVASNADFAGADVIGLSGNLFFVTYSDLDGTNDDVFFELFNTSGNAVTTGPQLIDGSFSDARNVHAAELSNGDIVVSWEIDGSGGTNNGIRFAIIDNVGFGFSYNSGRQSAASNSGSTGRRWLCNRLVR